MTSRHPFESMLASESIVDTLLDRVMAADMRNRIEKYTFPYITRNTHLQAAKSCSYLIRPDDTKTITYDLVELKNTPTPRDVKRPTLTLKPRPLVKSRS